MRGVNFAYLLIIMIESTSYRMLLSLKPSLGRKCKCGKLQVFCTITTHLKLAVLKSTNTKHFLTYIAYKGLNFTLIQMV